MFTMRNSAVAPSLQIALTEQPMTILAREIPRCLQRSTDQQDAQFKNVLVYAGSLNILTHAVTWGVRMARANSSALDLIHFVPDLPGAETDVETGSLHCAVTADSLESATRHLVEVIHAVRGDDAAVDEPAAPTLKVHIQGGTMDSLLTRVVRDHPMDLLVLEDSDLLVPHSPSAAILQQSQSRRGLSILLARPARTVELRRLTVVVDFTPTACFAVCQAINLARFSGAALRIVCPSKHACIEFQCMAEATECAADLESDCNDRFVDYLERWLPSSVRDLEGVRIARHQVPNWDYLDGVIRVLADEEADLAVLPLRRHMFFAGLQNRAITKRITSAVPGSLLIVRR